VQGDTVVLQKTQKPRAPFSYRDEIELTMTFKSADEADHFVSILRKCNGKFKMSNADDERRIALYKEVKY
jgi:hypothetical protein